MLACRLRPHRLAPAGGEQAPHWPQRRRTGHEGNMMSNETMPPGDRPNETTIPEGHVIFLLGAGASKDARFPLVDGLTCKLRKCLPYVADMDGNLCKEFPELFDAVAFRDPKAGKNYEHFFACLQLLIPGPHKPSHKLLSFNLEERLVKAAPYLAPRIAKPIVEELQGCHLDYDPSYLARLSDFVPKEGRLKVFTLNYDLCVEKAFQESRSRRHYRILSCHQKMGAGAIRQRWAGYQPLQVA